MRRPLSRLRACLGREAACLAGVVVLGAVVVALHVRADTRLSPIDEGQHVDYLAKAGQLQIPRSGETYGAVARQETACRGIEALYTPPPCAAFAQVSDSAYPEYAIDTAAPDPPLYYVVTGLAARAAQSILHVRSIVTVGRLLGSIWLAAGVVVLWLAMKELGIGLVARTAVGALIVTTPVVVLSSATVTSDAPLLLAGAAALYCVLLWERRRLSGWVVLAVAALCALEKVPCLLAVGAAALYLVVRAVRMRPGGGTTGRSRKDLLRMALGSAALAAFVSLAWLAVVNLRAIKGAPIAPSATAFHASHLRLADVLAQTGALITPADLAPVLAPLQGPGTLAIMTIVNYLLIGAAVGGAALSRPGGRFEGITTSIAVLMLVGGPAFVVAIYLSQGQILPDIPHRYGLALVPAAAVAIGAILAKAWLRWSVVALAVTAALYTLVRVALA